MMKYFIESLKERNEALFYFGLICMFCALVCIVLIKTTNTHVMGINAWYKPMKFFLSTTLFVWAMAWYMYYLEPSVDVTVFNWITIIGLSFELIYISLQAAKGQLSHFNVSTPFYEALFNLMALAITIVTLATAYIGLKFLMKEFPNLPDYYVWAIRLGIFLFVIFAFQGFVMGAKMAHTVGAADGGKGLPIVNWSTQNGDLRIAHFVGMHALQILPILSFYLLKNLKLTFLIAFLYTIFAAYTLIWALLGRPLFKI